MSDLSMETSKTSESTARIYWDIQAILHHVATIGRSTNTEASALLRLSPEVDHHVIDKILDRVAKNGHACDRDIWDILSGKK